MLLGFIIIKKCLSSDRHNEMMEALQEQMEVEEEIGK